MVAGRVELAGYDIRKLVITLVVSLTKGPETGRTSPGGASPTKEDNHSTLSDMDEAEGEWLLSSMSDSKKGHRAVLCVTRWPFTTGNEARLGWSLRSSGALKMLLLCWSSRAARHPQTATSKPLTTSGSVGCYAGGPPTLKLAADVAVALTLTG